MDRPTILVMAMFAVQFITNVLEFPIPTDPKSKGEEQVSGRATGAPNARIVPPEMPT
jgi:hypothetical protein